MYVFQVSRLNDLEAEETKLRLGESAVEKARLFHH